MLDRPSRISTPAPSAQAARHRYRALSRYRLLARLGSGGMAEVYLAVPNGFNKLQVLKLIRPDLSEEERHDFAQMFRDEGRLAARLNHPNIVQSHEVGSEDGNDFIAMEYLDGQPFSRIMERGWSGEPRFSLEMQLFVLCQVLDGLEYAHNLSDYDGTPLHIVHRDVSPQNIFVTYSGHTKLVDFGIAKTLESCKTRAGVMKGKVPYMSPEQVLNRKVDFRADLFSVGVILWECIARRPMHGTESVYEILRRLVHGELPPIRSVVPDVPEPLERILSRAVSVRPEDRYPNAGTFRDELAAFLDQCPKVSMRELGERLSRMFSAERSEFSDVVRRAMADLTAAPEAEPPAVHWVPTQRVLAASASSSAAESSVNSETVPQLPEGPKYPPAIETFRSADSIPEPSNGPRTTPVRPQPALGYDKNSTPPPVNTSRDMSPKPVAAKRWRLWAATAAIALVGIGAWAAGSGQRSREPTVTPLAPVSTTETPPPAAPGAKTDENSAAAAQPTGTAQQAANAAKAQLRVRANPEGAELFLDGARLAGNPAEVERPRDGSKHVLEVRAAGHRTRKIDLTFDRDRDLEVSLVEASGRSTAEKARVARAPQPAAQRAPVSQAPHERARTSSADPAPASEDVYDRFPSAPPQKPSPPPLDTRGAF
jgi:serine/threonine-protein kinase